MKNLAASLDAAEVAKLEALHNGRRPIGAYDPVLDPFDHFVAARDDYYFAAHDIMVQSMHEIEQNWPKPGQVYRSCIAALLLNAQRTERCRALKAASPEFSTERERINAEIELDIAANLSRIAHEKLGPLDTHGRYADPATQAEIAAMNAETETTVVDGMLFDIVRDPVQKKRKPRHGAKNETD